MKIHIDSKYDIKELDAGNRGRVSLGPKYANKHVQLAIIDTNDTENVEE